MELDISSVLAPRSGRTKIIRIESLAPADSPRLAGEVHEHAQRLAESESDLPPILVHGPTMRIIDGTHRVKAMAYRGRDEIEAEFYGGSPEDAFVLSVHANMQHGLPLSRADRRAAATRILNTHADWSDRSIAQLTGLSAKTIADLRCATAENKQLHTRIGHDGRVRPLNSAPGRRLAAEVLGQRPDASLREVAKVAGISPGTVRDVRDRLRRGESPIAERRSSHISNASPREARKRIDPVDVPRVLQSLAKDPSLRMTDTGRSVLQWLHVRRVDVRDCRMVVDSVPTHRLGVVVELARVYASIWETIAVELETQIRRHDVAS
jgi:ParB-like chromosome segregation protein Spo0J